MIHLYSHDQFDPAPNANLSSQKSTIQVGERENIKKSLIAAPKLQDTSLSSVAVLSDTLVVKYGWDVHLWEARNIELAASIPLVRAPKVYDAWEEEDRSLGEENVRTKGYIVMDNIRGGQLRSVWPSMDSEARNCVYEQLREMLTALHGQKFSAPGPVGGGVSRGFYFTQYDVGPFRTTHDMEQWFNERQRVCKDFNRVYQDEPDFSGAFTELVMCHMDIHMGNIILDPDNKIWLVDWCHAGGYPVWFEQAQASVGIGDPEDFEFRKGLLSVVSDESHSQFVRRLKALNFAVTTGRLLMPRERQTS